MKPPCKQNCDMREPLRVKYGNCHNEHCPYGWTEYDESREDMYQERVKKHDLYTSSPGRIKIARRRLAEAKRK